MNLYISNYTNLNTNTVTKQTYIDKFDKSLKLPFVSVLQNNLAYIKMAQENEFKPSDAELSVSDNVELSSAVTGATEANNTGQQGVS